MPDVIIAGRLKIWPGDLDEIALGKKRADVRRCDDRNFRAGQVWELAPWDPEDDRWIDHPAIFVRITHVERMAGPLMVFGKSRRHYDPIPLAVLSFEVL
jgi:hypothetical protein